MKFRGLEKFENSSFNNHYFCSFIQKNIALTEKIVQKRGNQKLKYGQITLKYRKRFSEKLLTPRMLSMRL